MKIVAGKKYIDTLGNISIVKVRKGFFGEVMEDSLQLITIDNIGFEYKHTVGRTGYFIDLEGKVLDGSRNCPLDIVRRFTIIDQFKLSIGRVVFKLAKFTSPKIIKYHCEL